MSRFWALLALLLFCCLLLAAVVLAALLLEGGDDGGGQRFPLLRHTFAQEEADGFFALPRTEEEADGMGWVKISGCGDDGRGNLFAGNRYVRDAAATDDIVLVLDSGGFVAGIQSVVPVAQTDGDRFFNYSASPFYLEGDLLHEKVYFVTVYFVDPASICGRGRTRRQFDEQGTVSQLFLQDGPSPDQTVRIPTLAQDAEPFLTRHKCFPLMGTHYYPWDGRSDFSCPDMFPVQVLYNGGVLSGIVFVHVADLEGERWEVLSPPGLGVIFASPPPCLVGLADDPGVRTMHVFFSDWREQCQAKGE